MSAAQHIQAGWMAASYCCCTCATRAHTHLGLQHLPPRLSTSPVNNVLITFCCRLWTNSYGKPLQAVYARGPSHDTARALSAAPLAGRNPDLPAQGRLSVGAAPG